MLLELALDRTRLLCRNGTTSNLRRIGLGKDPNLINSNTRRSTLSVKNIRQSALEASMLTKHIVFGASEGTHMFPSRQPNAHFQDFNRQSVL